MNNEYEKIVSAVKLNQFFLWIPVKRVENYQCVGYEKEKKIILVETVYDAARDNKSERKRIIEFGNGFSGKLEYFLVDRC